ncbi:MAG: UDP-N-acetylmuramyl peptide synthase [Bifidobacterium sp.]|uniref:UDP-N-acetylmuramyl peptide synthase n=1 Tax=Bifidobacterium sp. TaxID=41200 RepID=UPI0039E79623
MSSLGETMSQRMTLGYLGNHYGLAIRPRFCEPVTVTSLADDAQSVRPGALFVPSRGTVAASDIAEAEARGAYAVVLSQEQQSLAGSTQIPVLIGGLDAEQLGQLASDVAGEPSESLAVFTIAEDDSARYVKKLAEFLHTLGNPVGVVSAAGSYSLDRPLDVDYPVSIFDMERLMSVCLEDGAAAVIVAVNPQTLKPDALQAVKVDVVSLASSKSAVDEISRRAREATDEAARKADMQSRIKSAAQADFTQTVAIPVDELHHEKRREHEEKRKFEALAASRNQMRQAESRRLKQICKTYGLNLRKDTKVAARTEESDSLSRQAGISEDGDSQRQLSLSISMTMAAGVRKNNIKSALRVSKELS